MEKEKTSFPSGKSSTPSIQSAVRGTPSRKSDQRAERTIKKSKILVQLISWTLSTRPPLQNRLSGSGVSNRNDLEVAKKGSQLEGLRVDFLVSGGIAAVESPKIIRELRRYGAEVRVVMSNSAQDFVRPLVFEWASTHPVITGWTGQAEHISKADLVVVSPATLNFIAKLALGRSDCPASTLAHSVLGRIPFFVQASMHDSLMDSPAFEQHKKALSQIPKLHFLESLREEGKAKSADPTELVAEISHLFHKNQNSILVLGGPTRSPLDDVRYLSNRSSGAMSLELSIEAFRWGFDVDFVLGPTEIPIPRFICAHRVETSKEMREKSLRLASEKKYRARVFAAAVLDYEFSERLEGKKKSSEDSWQLKLVRSPKLIDSLVDPESLNVGFKLESVSNDAALLEAMEDLHRRSACQWVVGNRFSEVSAAQHRCLFRDMKNKSFQIECQSKKDLAQKLILEVRKYLGLHKDT